MSFPYKNNRKALIDSWSQKKFKGLVSNSKEEPKLFNLFTKKTIIGDGGCLYRGILIPFSEMIENDREYESFRDDYIWLFIGMNLEVLSVLEEENFNQYIQR